MKSGIYKIINLYNNHIYIGSAVDINGRKRIHLNRLRKGNHHSIYLQRAYNKYGEKLFKFETIERCEKEDLINREQYYMDELNPEYNICKIAGNTLGRKGTKEGNRRKSENHAMKGKFGKDNVTSKIIYQYDLGGNFLKDWGGAFEIERNLGFNAGNIRKSIKNKWTAYGFFWSYKDYGKLYKYVPKRKSRERTKKPIVQLTLKGEFIKEWDSAKSATKFLGKADGSLNGCLKNKTKTAYGYKWKYKNKSKK